jgi:hypothetical protein
VFQLFQEALGKAYHLGRRCVALFLSGSLPRPFAKLQREKRMGEGSKNVLTSLAL